MSSNQRATELARSYTAWLSARGLLLPAGVAELLSGKVGQALRPLVYWPSGEPGQPNNLDYATRLLDGSFWPAPARLLPLVPIDSHSIACAVCDEDDDEEAHEADGDAPVEVVRWHLGPIEPGRQSGLIDTDARLYLESLAEELEERSRQLDDIKTYAGKYQKRYVGTGKQPREQPRKHVPRPVQLACQNVIVGLGVLQQDATFDGLRVGNYLTCEAPHLATHEADRGMWALILCDAFQCGGTMEIRFGPPERALPVPAAVQRFGRSIGLDLGAEDPIAITPSEARSLFLGVTPMQESLWLRASECFDRGLLTPERICYTLTAGVWSGVELDYLLATSARAVSIIGGGSTFIDHRARLAESESCRAAVMLGMLFRRVSANDHAGGAEAGVRVYEDAGQAIHWSIDEDAGSVALAGAIAPASWQSALHADLRGNDTGLLIAVPRALPTPKDIALVREMAASHPYAAVALVVPADMAELVPPDVPLLVCPDRLGELDSTIESKLSRLRVKSA